MTEVPTPATKRLTIELEVELVDSRYGAFVIFPELCGDGETGEQVFCISDDLTAHIVALWRAAQ